MTCGLSPQDAGDVIGPAWPPWNGQHHITDLTAQRGPAIDRISAQDPFKGYLVPGVSILETNIRCEDKYEKPPFPIDPDVVGTKLAGHSDHAFFFGCETFHQICPRYHREHIYGRRQARYPEQKTVKGSSVIFV